MPNPEPRTVGVRPPLEPAEEESTSVWILTLWWVVYFLFQIK